MGTSDGYLLAVNADTGKPIESFGVNGKADLYPAIPRAKRNTVKMWSGETHYVSPNSPPVVVRDTVIVGSAMSDRPPRKDWPPGHVQAFDARSGKLKWVFHVIPEDGEFGADTWKDGSNKYTGNANVWTLMSGDDELGQVYLPISTPTSDYWGGFRKGDGFFADSLVAVNVETGKRVWHFQTVHHSVWDYDLPAAPTLARPDRARRSRESHRADQQAGFHLRLRSGQWPAVVADRGASGSQVGYSGRGAVADAAFSDQAAGVRISGRDRRSADRFHAGVER